MSERKHEVKIDTLRKVGSRLDDQLEAVLKELHGYEGAVQALKQAAKGLEGLNVHVDKDLDEGKFAELTDLQVAEAAKRYVQRAAGLLGNLATSAEVNVWKAHGKVEALQATIKHLKGMYDVENAKLDALRKALDSGEAAVEGEGLPLVARPAGVHPGDPLAERRKEAAAEGGNGTSQGG